MTRWVLGLGWLLGVGMGCVMAAGPGGMEEGEPDPVMQTRVERALARVCGSASRVPRERNQMALTWVDLTDPVKPRWAAHRGTETIYPASVVKLFYLVAAHRWMEDGRIAETEEMRRALRDMIVDSSNDATHYVLDVLTDTTSGPELDPEALKAWQERRNAVNRYFAGLGYRGINCNKKPWGDGPYGRETQAIRMFEPKRNGLTTDATARLMCDVARDRVVTPARCARMRELLQRDPRAASRPDDQTTGFIAGGLPAGAKLWSKAGWTSQTRHDCALVEEVTGRRWVLVIFTEGHAEDATLLPALTAALLGG
jgi:beta-lactamase class A